MGGRSSSRVGAAGPVVRELVLLWWVYAALALVNLRVKLDLTPSWFDGTLVENHDRLVAFEYTNNEQARLLQWGLPELLHRLGLSIPDAYLILRWLFVFAAFMAFHAYQRRWYGGGTAVAGVLFLAAAMPLTYLNHLQESAPLLLLTFILGLWAIREQNHPAFLVVLLVGSLNNETSLLLVVPFVVVNLDALTWPEIRRVAGLTALWAGPAVLVVGVMRYVTRDRPVRGGVWQLPDNVDAFWSELANPPLAYPRSVFLFFLFLYGAFWVYALLGLDRKPRFLRRTSLLIPVFVGVVFALGIVGESRLFLPLAPIVVPSALLFVLPQDARGAVGTAGTGAPA